MEHEWAEAYCTLYTFLLHVDLAIALHSDSVFVLVLGISVSELAFTSIWDLNWVGLGWVGLNWIATGVENIGIQVTGDLRYGVGIIAKDSF